ncbi:MAG: hypothetical protein IKL51_01695, partial [Lachnospiraceae bacterium]|nr:hypothetical protein [Lachnospiraceae bacterium]
EVMEEIQGEEGKENQTYVVTSVPYEITGYGMCRLSVTAADEIKSQTILQLREIADPRPDYHGGVVKINKNLSEKAADIPIVLGKETIVKRGEIKLTGTGANNFEFVTLNGSNQEELEGIVHGYVSLSNKSAEKGNYKLALEFPVYRKVNGQQLEKILDAKLNITISITDVMPKLTVKQNKKVNTFYTNESRDGFGMLTINSTEKITSVNLIAQKNGICDYELMSVDDSGATQWIKPKNETNFSGKKAVVQIYLEGYEKPVEKNITVAVEEKAPKLEFESKKFTFYPNFNLTGEEFMIINKTTQSSVFIQEMQWQESKTAQREITPEGISVNLKKNQYELKRTDRGVFVELKTKLAASDKLEVSVKEVGWRKAVKVSTTLATVIKEPKLALEKKKLELNTHPSVFDRQTAYAKVKLENSAINLHNAEILFAGQDAKSREALNNSIQLEFWRDTSEIVTRFNVTEAKDLPKDGTYKYRLTIKFHDLDKQLSADFTVNLKAKAPEKCVTISKQGKLDVLDRTGSVLVYKPKVNGLSGVVTHGELAGKDKDMFRTEWDGLSGCLYIYTNPWTTYSTKLNYEVIPVFEVLDHRIGSCRVYTKAEKIKVTQGKASVLIESQGNVLYEERNNELILTFNALLDKKYPMKVSKITLLNYTNDLGILGQDFWDEGEVMPRIQLGRIGVKQILQKGKKWNLKFEVELKDQAGNSKNVQVTYPVIIR